MMMEIAKKSGDLYDKFVGFLEDFDGIAKHLKNAQSAYDGALNKLQTGTGNILKRCEDIRKLGAKAKKAMPQQFKTLIADADEETS